MGNYSILLKVRNIFHAIDCGCSIKVDTLATLMTLSKDRKYIIPDYQREIRWKPENVSKLIKDISKNSKYLGSILLSTCDIGEVKTNIEIIDGQQRLTVLYMLIYYINKKVNCTDYSLCEFKNETYLFFNEILDLDFCKSKIDSSEKKKEYTESDVLNQRDRFEDIWNEIQKCLKTMTNNELNLLKGKILGCDINVIFNLFDQSVEGSKGICVDYYLDLNDSSVPLDEIDILKAHLFKRKYTLFEIEWAKMRKKVSELQTHGINYGLYDMFKHYFACKINEQVEYKIKSVPNNLKLQNEFVVNGYCLKKGIHFAELPQDDNFFGKMNDDISSFCEFMLSVKKDKKIYTDFRSNFEIIGRGRVDPDSQDNIYYMIREIVLHDNIGPKLLLMKYYLDVLKEDKCSKKMYKIMYPIFAWVTLFVAGNERKFLNDFYSAVLKKDWIEEVEKRASLFVHKNYSNVKYDKNIKFEGVVNEVSAMTFAKDIFAVKQFMTCNISQKTMSYNEKNIKKFLLSDQYNIEHFFVNKSGKFKIKIGSSEIEFTCPEVVKKFVYTPVDFWVIKQEVNSELETYPIVEKIRMLEKHGEEAFGSKLGYEFFKVAKEVFDTSEYPDYSSIRDLDEIKKMLEQYYASCFEQSMYKYIDKIKNLRV